MFTADEQLFAVLTALLRSPPLDRAAVETVRASAGGDAVGDAYLARLVREGWLDGSVDSGPDGTVRAVFVRSVTDAGRSLLVRRAVSLLSDDELHAVRVLSQRGGATSGEPVPAGLLRLAELGLVDGGTLPRLTVLGLLVAAEGGGFQGRGPTTVIQGVTNAQIAVGASQIHGSVSVEQPIDGESLRRLAGQITEAVEALPLAAGLLEEARADLATIHGQALSPKPKGSIVKVCAQNLLAIVQSASGSAAYAGVVELIRRLV